MLIRIPIAVIHAHGPSIRQPAMLASGTSTCAQPNRAVNATLVDIDVGVLYATDAEQAEERS